jgi:hypothetical protein
MKERLLFLHLILFLTVSIANTAIRTIITVIIAIDNPFVMGLTERDLLLLAPTYLEYPFVWLGGVTYLTST